MKEYKEGTFNYTVSQIESGNPDDLIKRKKDFIQELEIERRAHKAVFSALMVTDITRLTSILIAAIDPTYSQVIDFPKQEENVYVLADIVSRKKQLVPLLSEQVEKLS